MRSRYLLFLLIIFINSFGFVTQSQLSVGTYDIKIDILEYNFRESYAIANILINTRLPAGTGFVYIPLPISRIDIDEIIIEPTSSNNLVMIGSNNTDVKYTLIQISLNETPSIIEISLLNTKVPIQDSALSESNKAIVFHFDEVHEKLEENVVNFATPNFSSITIIGNNIQSINPPAFNSIDKLGYTINNTDFNINANKLTIFIAKIQNEVILYLLLAILGMFLGFVAAPKWISSKNRATIFLVLSIIALVILVLVFILILTPEQRSGTDLIITLATSLGIIIVFIFESIKFLLTI